jgi:hypothetical protein
MPVISARRSAIRWSYHNVAVELVARRAASRRLVRYEDLVADPEQVLRSILAGVRAPTPASFAFLGSAAADLGVDHTVSGNPGRLRQGTTPLRLDDEWTTAMPRRDARAVSFLTRFLLKRYGYGAVP